MADYSAYNYLSVEVREGVAVLTMPVMNRARISAGVHTEVGRIWRDIGDDPAVRAAIITGSGDEFYNSGQARDFRHAVTLDKQGTWELVQHVMKEAQAIVYEMVNLDKPIITAINGTAAGAGLAVALMGDITIAAEDAQIIDPHIALGITVGDHAAMIWPLLCGMARAKRYLLTAEPLDGREAERIGVVSLAVPRDRLMETAQTYAAKLANGPQHAIRFTKRALNQWLRLGGVTAFDYSLALEMLTFFSPEVETAIRPALEREARG